MLFAVCTKPLGAHFLLNLFNKTLFRYKKLSTARIIQTLPAKAIMTSRMPWKTLSRTKRATGRETTSPTNAPGIPQSAALTTTGVYSPAAA